MCAKGSPDGRAGLCLSRESCLAHSTLLAYTGCQGGLLGFWATNREAVGSHSWEMINLSSLILFALCEDGQVARVENASIIFDIAKVNSDRNPREA